MQKRKSFSFSVHIPEGAHQLSLEWVRKMQYFYNIWRAQELPRFEFSPQDEQEYRPSQGWLDFMQQLPAAGILRDKAEALNLLCPEWPRPA